MIQGKAKSTNFLASGYPEKLCILAVQIHTDFKYYLNKNKTKNEHKWQLSPYKIQGGIDILTPELHPLEATI